MFPTPYTPIPVAELAEGALFQSPNARLVRAGFWMLQEAWRSVTPGSLSSSFTAIASASRLTEAEVAEHYALLTEGWSIRSDSRLYHDRMSELIDAIDERFGDELMVMRESCAVLMQAPQHFELMPSERVAAAKRKRVKGGECKYPKEFALDTTSQASIIALGYINPEHQEWIFQQFRDYATRRNVKNVDWQAAFRTYASTSYTSQSFKARFGYWPNESRSFGVEIASREPVTGLSASDRLRRAATPPQTFQTAMRQNSESAVYAAINRRSMAGSTVEAEGPSNG